MNFADKRLTVLVGNYGSGKTELSLAIARKLNKIEKVKTALVDLDVVNPYFRSAEHHQQLEKENIRVLMPTYAMTGVDIPALPAEIQSVFDVADEHVVFDVGGDDTGAAALGRYVNAFEKERDNVRCLYVINCMRPLTQKAEDIWEMMQRIAARSRMGFSGLVNNTNLADDTTPQMLLEGQEVITHVAALSGIPIVMISGKKQVLDALPERYQPLRFNLKREMKPEWME